MRALRGMFDLMNGGFQRAPGPEIGSGHPAAKLLGHFDAIFTLNQDTLIEQRYTPTNPQRWNGMLLPGTTLLDPKKGELFDLRVPDDPTNFKLASNFQAYFKLHGSSSFRQSAEADDALLIMGGDKLASIDGSVLLKWYRSEFQRFLAIPDTRLVVIGYSFGDQHINELIRQAATAGNGLQIFIVDPSGVDVLYNRPTSKSSVPPSHGTDNLLKELTPVLYGASRRSLESLFRHPQPDEIERSKLYRFLGL